MTNYELLHNKRIANVYDGRPDGSVLIRLDDRTEILIRSGAIMLEDEAWPLGIDVGTMPDLLAACKEYVAAVEDPEGEIQSPQKMVDAEENLQSAIAKAEA
jgi:hypothetical protein